MRGDGPPQIPASVKGSRDHALQVAGDAGALTAARGKFDQLIYAPNTVTAKATRAGLWTAVAAAMGVEPFPLTPEKVLGFAAVLKEAGYRSGYFYLTEVQQQHVRAGFVVDGPLQTTMADAKRGLERALGPPGRSAEIRPESWDELAADLDAQEVELDRQVDSPRGGLFVWGLGTGWLLREIELSLLNVHSETLRLHEDGSVTLRISTSKTDPGGRGAARTLPCTCGRRGRPSCAPCSARVLLEEAMSAWGGDRESDEARLRPLIGTMADPGVVVAKAAIVRAARADVGLLQSRGRVLVSPAEVTGHFMRRSGAKHLARQGYPLHRIQWLGRWGSAAVLAYVEEAAEEAPESARPASEQGWDELRADLAQVLRSAGSVGDLSRPEIRERVVQDGLAESRLAALEVFAASAQRDVADAQALARELDQLVRPTLVLNKITRVVHRALRTERLDPEMASTWCGWKWAKSTRSRPVGPDEVDLAGGLWTWCPRCSVAPAQEGHPP